MNEEEEKDPVVKDAPDTPGGEKPLEVGERPNVSTVTPEDYPDTRKGS